MNEKIFLFGAGKMAEGYTDFLEYLQIKIEGYFDNDNSRWDTYFRGRKIYSPDILKNIQNVVILIACADEEGITYQLSRMAMQDKIISINQIIRKGIESIGKREIYQRYSCGESDRTKTVIVDNFNGAWGGAEDWAHKVAEALMRRGHQVVLIENDNSKTIKEIIGILLEMRPFILINIWCSELLWSAAYIKRIYPKDVKVITAVLNDHDSLYQNLNEWDCFIDSYLCISKKIVYRMKSQYGIKKGKLSYKEPFIENRRESRRHFSVNYGMPLKIGYPCRLEKFQKRADLVPVLLEDLEKKGINYQLSIVGDGPCKSEIVKYVDDRCLHKKVKIYGKMTRLELIEFLYDQDIYLNFSEFEGTSLTMLEAMASGCVPVVTNVSGVEDFIINRVNGMISDVGDMESLTDHILIFDKNRELLEEYGQKCIEVVSNKCNFDDYIGYIEKNLHME